MSAVATARKTSRPSDQATRERNVAGALLISTLFSISTESSFPKIANASAMASRTSYGVFLLIN